MKRIVTICFGFVLLALVAPNVAMAQKNATATKGNVEQTVPAEGADVEATDVEALDLQTLDSQDDASKNQVLEVGFWDLFMAGGWLMWVLVLLAGVMIFIFVERFLAIRKATQIDPHFMNRIRDYISEGNIDAAVDLCRRTDSPIARMVEKGIERIGRPMGDIQTAIENVANVEVAKLETGLPWLASISGGAPMIGFLGTVVGMVGVFIDMSAKNSGGIQINDLADGMYVAMVTTIGGLVVGIPAYFAHNYLVARIEKLIFRMEATTIAFMDILNQPAQK
jgi:biopolymer transport protein ExbB